MGGVPAWYEAEAMPPNTMCPTCVRLTNAAKCATTPPRVGDQCDSAGGEVDWIVIARGGFLQFNDVSAPADGLYDVTWYYKCDNNDNYGDMHCGGQANPPTTPSGCRPHQITVNGVDMPGTYHFPCFPGSWAETHVATTPVPLKAGNANTIKIWPKERDSANIDAMHVLPPGTGLMPVITANATPGAN